MVKNSNTKTANNALNRFPGVIYHRHQDARGNISYEFLNDEIYRILDISTDEEVVISSKGYIDSVHWADRYLISQQIEKSANDLQPYTERFRIISKKGQVHWLSGTITPSVLENGEIMWEGFLLDETSKKQAEQKLNIILESSNDVIINTDKNGTITEVNSSIKTMFGYDINEIIGQNISFILSPEDKEECANYIKSYLEEANEVYEEAKSFEYLGLKKNSDIFPIDFSISALRIQGVLSFIILIKDIREQKETLATLKDTEEKLSTIVSALPCSFFTALITSENDYKIIYLSDGCYDIFGFSPEEFYNNPEIHEKTIIDDDKFNRYISKLYSNKKLLHFDEEFPNQIKDGNWIQVRIKPELLSSGNIICHGVIIDVTDRIKSSERIKYLAYYHTITGTANRALLGKEMISIIEGAKEKEEKIAVLSIASNNINLFYSSSGHDIGDSLLKEMSDRIKLCLKDTDFIAYTSSGLFVVVLPNIKEEKEASALAEKILRKFNSSMSINEQIFDININIGIAMYPDHGDDTNALIKNSSAALEKAKKEYKDYRFFTEEINEAIANTNTLRTKLRHALGNGEIVPYFQPQIDISSGQIVGTEALARWESDEGLIPPGIFIPIAEEYGLIDYIAETLLEKACQHNQNWIEQGILSAPVAVNISPRQFQNPKHLLNIIEDALEKTGMAPDKLEIELTESSTMINPQEAEKVIKTLLDKGITCSIDDFGTGYSSLSVLKRFPLSKLKIDRSFVIDIANDESDASIVGATIAMAKALKLKVLAEGVETKDIYKFLKKMGCTSIQGYLFSKPLPANEMTEFAKNWDSKEILKSMDAAD